MFNIYIYICIYIYFFSIKIFFHGHWQLTGQQGKGGPIFYSTLPLPPAHEHSDIYLQLCTWGGYHIFFIAMLVLTRLLLDEIYHLIELLFDWLKMWYWFLFTCLLNWFFVLLQLFDMRNRWTRTHIDYHPCITSEPTKC